MTQSHDQCTLQTRATLPDIWLVSPWSRKKGRAQLHPEPLRHCGDTAAGKTMCSSAWRLHHRRANPNQACYPL